MMLRNYYPLIFMNCTAMYVSQSLPLLMNMSYTKSMKIHCKTLLIEFIFVKKARSIITTNCSKTKFAIFNSDNFLFHMTSPWHLRQKQNKRKTKITHFCLASCSKSWLVLIAGALRDRITPWDFLWSILEISGTLLHNIHLF